MKKNFKILFINILLLITSIFVLEFIAFSINIYRYRDTIYSAIKSGDKLSNLLFTKPFDIKNYDENYRNPSITNSTLKPIIVFGCSFASGDALGENETISARLSQLTNRTVYNRSDGGLGPQMMLFQLKSGQIKEITNKCEYIIFVNIDDSKNRCLMYRCWPFLHKVGVKYKTNKDNELVLNILPDFLVNCNIYKLLEDTTSRRMNNDKINKFFFLILKESYKQSQLLYPNSKFIILNYSKEKMEIENELKKIGLKIINFQDLNIDANEIFSTKYQISEYDSHPNAKAWEYIVPRLIKNLDTI